MWRTLVGGVVGCLTLVGQSPGGEAPTVDEVAAAIAQDGWYAHPDAVGDREQLALLADRLEAGNERMGFALLAAEPPGSSTAFAEDVLDAIPGEIETVVVLSDADVGVASDEWSDRSIDDALDETIDDLRANPTDGIEALADALVAAPSDVDSDDGGSGDPNTGLFIVGLVVLIAGSYIWNHMTGGELVDEDDDGSSSSSWSRRRRSSFSRSSWRSSSRRSSSSSSSSRRSSSGRGRGGRRL